MRAVTELIELSHRKIEVCCFSDYHRSGQRTNALLVGSFSQLFHLIIIETNNTREILKVSLCH